MKVKMKQLRSMMFQQNLGGGGSSNSNMEMFEMLARIQSKDNETVQKMMGSERDFWKASASHNDPIGTLARQKKDLIELGVVQNPNTEKPSEYQKQVIDSARQAGREIFAETKDEIRPLIESLRDDFLKPISKKILEEPLNKTTGKSDTKTPTDYGQPKDVKSIPPNDMDAVFDALNAAAVDELANNPAKHIKTTDEKVKQKEKIIYETKCAIR
ncbi:hypothetical protein SBF1_4590001 [Candidatus Desulfosporosinus infrequens]|uniref:Uncharacterized protein n=1 Tax=Candidatus Desulfosporosinus infrequens TaxID=2043169 RepID=A0A2U3LCK9_9FIRM|nr:hypothetical protein SBF1_4590001 [Candidatus Desulfosporosinus infrequens]